MGKYKKISYIENLKSLIPIENKEFNLTYLLWFYNEDYKVSHKDNEFSNKNIFKEKLPNELYEEFKINLYNIQISMLDFNLQSIKITY